jgi:protein O-mannosyl-transferase
MSNRSRAARQSGGGPPAAHARPGTRQRPDSRQRRDSRPRQPSPEAARLVTLRLAAAALLALCAAIYWNSFGVGFLLDNTPIILGDPRIRTIDWQNVRDIFAFNYWYPTFESDLFRPLTTLSYAVNYALLGGGENPFGYHLVNLLLHWTNTVLVFVLVRELTGKPFAALFAAAVLACHPLTVESVTNIVGRADLLAAMSILGGLLLYRRFLEADGKRKLAWVAALGAAYLAGVFSKENAVVLPGLMLLHDFAFPAAGDGGWPAAVRRRAARCWPAYLAIVPGLAALIWARWALFHNSPIAGQHAADNPIAMADTWTAVMTAFKVLGYYLGLAVWPSSLSVDYSYNQVTLFGWTLTGGQDAHAWLALIVLAVLATAAAIAWRRQPEVLFFLGLAAAVLLPTANLLFPVGTIMAERFMYLPLAGLAAAAAVALVSAGERHLAGAVSAKRRAWARAAGVAAIAIVMALGARTVVRNGDWQSDERLWASSARAAPDSYRVHMAMASITVKSDPSGTAIDEALKTVARALEIVEGSDLPLHHRPVALYLETGWYHLRRGQLLAAGGEQKPAREALDQALARLDQAQAIDREVNRRARETLLRRGWHASEVHDIGNPSVYRNLGSAHLLRGEPLEAVAALSYMQRIAPRNDDGHYARGLAEAAAGQRERDAGNEVRAVEHMEVAAVNLIVATLLNRNNELAWQVLAKVYEQFGTASAVVLGRDAARQLNLDEPMVSRHLKQASVQLVRQLREGGLREDADWWRDRMIHEFRLPAELFAPAAAANPPA